MSSIKAQEEMEIQYVSPTGLACSNRCLAKYYFQNLLRLRKRGAMTIALDYGKCIHCCIHKAYLDPKAALDIFLDEWNEYPHRDSDKKRNPTRALATLEEFHFMHFQERATYQPLDPPSGIIESLEKYNDYEAPFLIDVGACYPLYGKIDRSVKWLADGRKWPLDYKTSSEVSARIFNNFTSTTQTLGYTLAHSYLTGEDAPGIIYELLRTSDRNAECMLHPIFVRPVWLETFVGWTKNQCQEIQRCNEQKNWPKNPCGCAPYGMFGTPGYACDYELLCSLDDWREGVKFYDVHEWNPLKKKGE